MKLVTLCDVELRMLCMLLLLLPGLWQPLHAQTVPVGQIGVEWGSIASGSHGFSESGLGVAASVGVDYPAGGFRVVASRVAERDATPGWHTIGLELGPRWSPDPVLELAVRMLGGGYRTNADARRRIAEGCLPPCLFEAPSFESGWAAWGGASAEVTFQSAQRFRVSGGMRLGRLLKGANSGSWRATWNAGLGLSL